MSQGAQVKSIDAIQEFRAALQTFCHEAAGALVDVDLEARRSLDWLLDEQPKYWQMEARQANDAILQSKAELSRARSRGMKDEHPSCMVERKNVERAKRRLEHAEEKIKATRKWGQIVDHEVTEYQGKANQFSGVLDGTLPGALALLERIIINLEGYVSIGSTGGGMSSSGAGGGSSATTSPLEEPPAQPAAPTAQKDTAQKDTGQEDADARG